METQLDSFAFYYYNLFPHFAFAHGQIQTVKSQGFQGRESKEWLHISYQEVN